MGSLYMIVLTTLMPFGPKWPGVSKNMFLHSLFLAEAKKIRKWDGLRPVPRLPLKNSVPYQGSRKNKETMCMYIYI